MDDKFILRGKDIKPERDFKEQRIYHKYKHAIETIRVGRSDGIELSWCPHFQARWFGYDINDFDHKDQYQTFILFVLSFDEPVLYNIYNRYFRYTLLHMCGEGYKTISNSICKSCEYDDLVKKIQNRAVLVIKKWLRAGRVVFGGRSEHHNELLRHYGTLISKDMKSYMRTDPAKFPEINTIDDVNTWLNTMDSFAWQSTEIYFRILKLSGEYIMKHIMNNVPMQACLKPFSTLRIIYVGGYIDSRIYEKELGVALLYSEYFGDETTHMNRTWLRYNIDMFMDSYMPSWISR